MDVKVKFKGGGSFVNHRPVFSTDGEQVFVSWKSSILQYSTKTGKLLYEFKSLSDAVAGFSYHEFNSYQCLTACSVSGEVAVWKSVTNFKIFDKRIPKNITNIKSFHVVPGDKEDELCALVSYKHKGYTHFTLCNLTNKTCKEYNLKLDKGDFALDVARNSKYFAVVKGNLLHIVQLNNFQKIWKQLIYNSRQFTCVACHPTEEMILTGDSSGRVVAWQGLFQQSERPQSVFHWHTLPVNCVAFSTSGSYFYSGADECVLVKWDMDNPLQRKFVPRLPAEIRHITVSENNVFVGVSTGDNAVRVLDCRLDQVTLIQHLVLGNQFKSGILYDSKTRALVMNGNVGHVQFYSPCDMSLLYNVDIVGQNKMTNERNCQIENTQVTKTAISKTGGWLATVEERDDKNYHYEIRLKFWKLDKTKQTFLLNTSVEYPHETPINNILFQPLPTETDLKLVTIGDDKKFKIWQLVEVDSVYNKGEAWKCFTTGFYRDLPCQGLSFSTDGSLMATAFGPLLTTWLPDSCELKCSLVHPNYRQVLTHVQFGNSTQCHLLVAASAQQLSVWNLLTLSMIWTVPLKVSLLVADGLSSHMAVFTKDKKVYVFCPGSQDLIFSQKDLVSKQESVVAATFAPSKYSSDKRQKWFERSHLYFVNSNNELYSLCGDDEENHVADFEEETILPTPFSMMLPRSKSSTTSIAKPSKHIFEKDPGHATIKKYLDAPLHTMVPIRLCCGSLLKSLVLQKESVN